MITHMKVWVGIVQLIIVVVGGAAVWHWFFSPIERAGVHIMAGTIPDSGLLVFAQFTVTQLLHVDDEVYATKLIVPMYVPVAGQPLAITLSRYGNVVQRWNLPRDVQGSQDVVLLLDVPQLLDGDLEVLFDGQDIPYGDKDIAPRIFVEPSDAGYPNGHYRIADNDKEGDVALQIMEEVPAGSVWWKKHRPRPFDVAALAVFIALTVWLVAFVPQILADTKT